MGEGAKAALSAFDDRLRGIIGQRLKTKADKNI